MKSKVQHAKDVFSDRAEEIICAAMEIKDPAGRSEYVERACAGDAALRARVDEFLSVQSDVERFFDDSRRALQDLDQSAQLSVDAAGDGDSASPGSASRESLGTTIGPYKLLEIIGEGGCGVVYMAKQEKPVHRHVALKIIKLGMDTNSVIARFRAEQQALALMDHPNIAHVLDAGATEKGRPYFVMDMVRGVKLTAYCDQNQLGIRQRLSLFIQVCHAIQHAHQKGIVHRDIKPSNILVTVHDGVPMPMVIDFGIAKAIEGRLTDLTLFTPYEQFVGTPAYMSPEQAGMSQVDVDTRSDIYSLGVLLYELLTGQTPFEAVQLLDSGLDGMRRTLRECDPLRPSVVITKPASAQLLEIAHSRRAEPAKLLSTLRGDLDWIVMKALEKDRNRRYQTANALAMEVQRYLDNEPILARPPSQAYRLRKFIRKNKVVFASGLALIMALAVGFGVSTDLLVRAQAAEREEARLRKLAEQGLSNEAELRRQAEGREKIMQAAMLIAKKDYGRADELIVSFPLDQSTMAGADVFRALGEWNALQGRWLEAKQRFHLLEQVSQGDIPANASLDFTEEAVAIVKCNDRGDYARFCRDDIDAFQSTEDPLVADRALRNCLLMPASPALINMLGPLAQCAKKPLVDIEGSTNAIIGWQLPWRCQVAALWEFRTGNPSKAVDWCRRCLTSEDRLPARDASAQVILAMSLQLLGKTEEAQAQLEQARGVIEPKFKNPLTAASSDGAWYDWEISRILFEEAAAMIGGPPENFTGGLMPNIAD